MLKLRVGKPKHGVQTIPPAFNTMVHWETFYLQLTCRFCPCSDETSSFFFLRSCPCIGCGGLQRQKADNHQSDLLGVCVQDVCYVLHALFAQGAAAHPADLPIGLTHLVMHPADFPITPTQPQTPVTLIRPARALSATHRCAYYVRRLRLLLIMYSCQTAVRN